MKQFLNGRACFVTGGTQGIGWAIAQALAERGGQVFVCGRSTGNLERAEAARQHLPWPDRLHLAQCDVTVRADLENWIGAGVAATGRADVLVNNAAYVRWENVATMTVAEAEQTMRVAYNGMVFGVKTVLPLMQTQEGGHIVNIGSIAGRIFVGGASAAYAAAKAAIDAYTQTLQVEVAQTPVHATLVRLGTVAGTDFFKQHVSTTRMPPLTRFMPALTPPRVATAVVEAIYRKKEIITLPRYLAFLTLVYNLAPRFARRLAQFGGGAHPDYGSVSWQYQHDRRNRS